MRTYWRLDRRRLETTDENFAIALNRHCLRDIARPAERAEDLSFHAERRIKHAGRGEPSHGDLCATAGGRGVADDDDLPVFLNRDPVDLIAAAEVDRRDTGFAELAVDRPAGGDADDDAVLSRAGRARPGQVERTIRRQRNALEQIVRCTRAAGRANRADIDGQFPAAAECSIERAVAVHARDRKISASPVGGFRSAGDENLSTAQNRQSGRDVNGAAEINRRDAIGSERTIERPIRVEFQQHEIAGAVVPGRVFRPVREEDAVDRRDDRPLHCDRRDTVAAAERWIERTDASFRRRNIDDERANRNARHRRSGDVGDGSGNKRQRVRPVPEGLNDPAGPAMRYVAMTLLPLPLVPTSAAVWLNPPGPVTRISSPLMDETLTPPGSENVTLKSRLPAGVVIDVIGVRLTEVAV